MTGKYLDHAERFLISKSYKEKQTFLIETLKEYQEAGGNTEEILKKKPQKVTRKGRTLVEKVKEGFGTIKRD